MSHIPFLLDVYPGSISPHIYSNFPHIAIETQTEITILAAGWASLTTSHKSRTGLGGYWEDQVIPAAICGWWQSKNLCTDWIWVVLTNSCLVFHSYRMAICTQYGRLIQHATRGRLNISPRHCWTMIHRYPQNNLTGGPSPIDVGQILNICWMRFGICCECQVWPISPSCMVGRLFRPHICCSTSLRCLWTCDIFVG